MPPRAATISAFSRSSRAESVERFGIPDENTIARRLVRRPRCEQIEQHGVIGRFLWTGMRPVAAPHETLGRSLYEGLRGRGRIVITGRPDTRIHICARNLDPGAGSIEQVPD